MSGKERGVFRLIWKHFFASIKPNFKRPKLVGEDYYGTKYYESQTRTDWLKKRTSRSFKPVNDFDQEMPAEWEAWLRHRRVEPPTSEEIERNYMIAMSKKEKAAEIEAKFGNAKSEKPQTLIDSNKKKKFPKYDEYKS
nr:NADH dehydrogenase [ubiquinone] 1 alpha subcomplex assembly factor 2 [Megalopta genalis]XP_033324766.1 NADH dehydrogenase [ubiquinone] 1 alpha subcomplex assembly factor 2 [Megalopta genalis]